MKTAAISLFELLTAALWLLSLQVVSVTGAFTSMKTVGSVSAFTRSSTSTSSSTSSTPLSMSTDADAASKQSYANVFVAGGSKGVGRHVVDLLLQNEETSVTALVRSEEAQAELEGLPRTKVVFGDAADYKAVEGAMDGCDAVVTTLGGGGIDYPGNSNVIEAAGILGVTRVVLVTSIGCGNSKDAIPESAREVLKDALEGKTKAEKVLQKYYTNTNWTIVRPGGLKSEPQTGTAVLTSDPTVCGTVHREDVARLVVAALTSQNTMRTVLSAVDPGLMATDAPTVEAFPL